MGSKLSWIIDNLVNKKYLTVYTVVTLVEESTEKTQKSLLPHTEVSYPFSYRKHLSESGFWNQTGNRTYSETNSKNTFLAWKCLIPGLIFSGVYSVLIHTTVLRSHLSGDWHKAHTTKEKWSMCLKIETNLFRMYEKIILVYGWKV